MYLHLTIMNSEVHYRLSQSPSAELTTDVGYCGDVVKVKVYIACTQRPLDQIVSERPFQNRQIVPPTRNDISSHGRQADRSNHRRQHRTRPRSRQSTLQVRRRLRDHHGQPVTQQSRRSDRSRQERNSREQERAEQPPSRRHLRRLNPQSIRASQR